MQEGQRERRKKSWMYCSHKLISLSWCVTVVCLVQLYLFLHREFLQGVSKIKNGTCRSDPVRCREEQNITSCLFLTSEQTFSGPLLPKSHTTPTQPTPSLSNRGKQSDPRFPVSVGVVNIWSKKSCLKCYSSGKYTNPCRHTHDATLYLIRQTNPFFNLTNFNNRYTHISLCCAKGQPLQALSPSCLVQTYLFL